MRILFICQFFTPDITAAAFRMSDFARLLAAAGDEVRVITSYPHKAHVDQVDDRTFETAGIRVDRCRLPEVRAGYGARSYLRHYLSFVRGSLRLGWRVWREGWRPDVIYASSPPLFVGLSGRVLSMLFRCPWVFEVRDIWPAAAVSAGQLRADSRAYRLGQRMERYLYRHADHLTCVAAPMRDYLVQQTERPVTVVYNGIATDSITAVPVSSHPPENSPRVLLYAGNLGHVQQLDLLLEAMAQLSHEADLRGWQVQILGTGAQHENLRRLADQLHLDDRVRFLPTVTRDEAARRLSGADLLYLHLMHDETMERTIPSKLFDYLLAARPILAGLAGEGTQILASTGANVVFPPGDLAALKASLLHAIRHYGELNCHAEDNRQLVLSRFTREQAACVLRGVFQSLIKQPQPG
jgi:glycosyltransferase involved in cell wall biosynthesis